MYKKIIASVAIFIGLGSAYGQQISMFNSYTLNRFLINPSYAGINQETNVFGINRIQYAGFDGAPVTFMLTADGGFKDKKFGIGGLLFSDRNNLISQNGFQFSYAYSIKLNDAWNIAMGLNAGMSQFTLNFDQLSVDDISESVLSNYTANSSTFRSDFGLRITSEKIEFGLALPQVVSSKVKYSDYIKNANGQYTSVPHYIANLSYLLSLKENLSVKPMVVVRGASGIKPQIDIVGLVDLKNKAYATIGYRTGYALSVGGGLKVSKGVSFGYTYDKPMNAISAVTKGSHEFMLGITLGKRTEEKPEPSKDLSKELEAKLKTDIEKNISSKLSAEFETKLKAEIELSVNSTVNEKIETALANRPVQTTPSEIKTTPSDAKAAPTETKTTSASISREELDKIKRDIEEKLQKQLADNFNKLIDEKIKKIAESTPKAQVAPAGPAQPSKEELEKSRKESEQKIRKEVEETLKKELANTINLAVDSKVEKEMQKAKQAEANAPKELQMTAKDKESIESLQAQNLANEQKIAHLEILLKSFPESDRIENEQLRTISRIVHQNDIELKEFKLKNRSKLETAKDASPKKPSEETETADEASKFVLVLAAFKNQKEAQAYQKLASQTFEFSNTRILKPENPEGWYFVYQKSFDKKKMAWEAHDKISNAKYNTPNFPWIFISE